MTRRWGYSRSKNYRHCLMLARLALRRSRSVTAALLLLATVCAALGLPPRIDGDLLNLVPADQPEVIALQALRSGPGGDSLVLVALPEDADVAAQAEAMLAQPTVQDVFYELNEDLTARLGALRLEGLRGPFRYAPS